MYNAETVNLLIVLTLMLYTLFDTYLYLYTFVVCIVLEELLCVYCQNCYSVYCVDMVISCNMATLLLCELF